MRNGQRFIRLLREGEAHQGIAQIDDKLRDCHFDIAAAGHDDRQSGNLSGRGQIRHGNEKRDPWRKPCIGGSDPKAKRYGNVAERDRNPLPQSAEKVRL